eukprot:CAMPEP_0170200652 /NCGR_PEP_ID=MMETSP0040_2-20121228/69976_1 /TAXON_ID=641309 /ORGANISM="Lotharella oceanica, Strain CCMP622" /LENGTH=251 /DNA_ID=CAMNT_0010450837 /DNA_START=597 /DNA_END=1352 /DNA_ORIENTATION=-
MLTFETNALIRAMTDVAKQFVPGLGSLRCPYTWCNIGGLSEDALWTHLQLYHCNHKNVKEHRCPICNVVPPRNLQVHYRNSHGPVARGEIPKEESTGVFAIVICRRASDGKFLMTQEFAQTGFWVPGGQLDKGESLCAGALRECLEEAGVPVKLKGVLEVLVQSRYWRRVCFYGEPEDGKDLPKTYPDYESTGACWVSVEELDKSIPFRSASELKWMKHVASGGKIAPLRIPKEYEKIFDDIQFDDSTSSL